MKRDMDLVRAILLIAENHEDEYLQPTDFRRGLSEQFPDSQWSSEKLAVHVKLLEEAGLVDAKFHTGGESFFDLRLTWEGHEFISDARDPGVWENVKSKAGDSSFTLLKQILVEVAKSVLS